MLYRLQVNLLGGLRYIWFHVARWDWRYRSYSYPGGYSGYYESRLFRWTRHATIFIRSDDDTRQYVW